MAESAAAREAAVTAAAAGGTAFGEAASSSSPWAAAAAAAREAAAALEAALASVGAMHETGGEASTEALRLLLASLRRFGAALEAAGNWRRATDAYTQVAWKRPPPFSFLKGKKTCSHFSASDVPR